MHVMVYYFKLQLIKFIFYKIKLLKQKKECSANCKTCEDNADKCLTCEDY